MNMQKFVAYYAGNSLGQFSAIDMWDAKQLVKGKYGKYSARVTIVAANASKADHEAATTASKQQQREPTSAANMARIEAMFDNKALQTTLENLYGRWLDEAQYEDINEYGKVIAKQMPAGITLTKMTKRPFGFHFTVGTDAVYALTMSARSMGWKRIA